MVRPVVTATKSEEYFKRIGDQMPLLSPLQTLASLSENGWCGTACSQWTDLDDVAALTPALSYLSLWVRVARLGVFHRLRTAMPGYLAGYAVHARCRCGWADRRRR